MNDDQLLDAIEEYCARVFDGPKHPIRDEYTRTYELGSERVARRVLEMIRLHRDD